MSGGKKVRAEKSLSLIMQWLRYATRSAQSTRCHKFGVNFFSPDRETRSCPPQFQEPTEFRSIPYLGDVASVCICDKFVKSNFINPAQEISFV
jgi:hypothetical protein